MDDQKKLLRFDTIYENYADMLYRLAFSYTKNSHDAEDIIQEVFIRYLKSNHSFQSEEHERAWLVRVTIHRCYDFHRSKKIHIELQEEKHIVTQTQDTYLLDQLSILPKKYKAVIILHHLEGYSIEEISFMLRCSISAVKMRLVRGRRLLKKEMEDHHV